MTFRVLQKVPKIVTDMHSVAKNWKTNPIFQSSFSNFNFKKFCENHIFTFLLVGATVFKVYQCNVPHFLATCMGTVIADYFKTVGARAEKPSLIFFA